jgi:hypothetical protein
MANKLITSAMLEEIKIEHHGILGMKWGVRKDVGADGTTKKVVLSTDLPTASPRSITDSTKRIKQEIEDDIKNRITNVEDIPRFNPKNESIATAIKKVNEGYSHNSSLTDKDLTDYNLIKKDIWGEELLDFENNCPSAAFSYELRRRGFDVEAGLTGGTGVSTIGEMYKMPQGRMDEIRNNGVPPRTTQQVEQDMRNMGPGARGSCMYEWANGMGGHIASFEIDAKGNIVYIDAQTGEVLEGRYEGTDNFYVFRTDDLEIEEEMIPEWTRLDDRVDPEEEAKRKAEAKRKEALAKQKAEAQNTAQNKKTIKTSIASKAASIAKSTVDLIPSKIDAGKNWVTNKFKKR